MKLEVCHESSTWWFVFATVTSEITQMEKFLRQIPEPCLRKGIVLSENGGSLHPGKAGTLTSCAGHNTLSRHFAKILPTPK